MIQMMFLNTNLKLLFSKFHFSKHAKNNMLWEFTSFFSKFSDSFRLASATVLLLLVPGGRFCSLLLLAAAACLRCWFLVIDSLLFVLGYWLFPTAGFSWILLGPSFASFADQF